MGSSERAALMAASVAAAARAAGLEDEAADLLSRAHALAMAPRLAALDDDHHPAYLHPGRTALLLLRDVGPLPAEVLAAAVLHETVDEELRVPTAVARSELGATVADVLESLPLSGDETLAERLVTLSELTRIVALAERLDQLRHAHLRPELDWEALHDEAGSTWVPVAERTHTRLAERYRHWHRTFARRLPG
jgi:(p)ppGpp synthase/HD superfamily hydrolase